MIIVLMPCRVERDVTGESAIHQPGRKPAVFVYSEKPDMHQNFAAPNSCQCDGSPAAKRSIIWRITASIYAIRLSTDIEGVRIKGRQNPRNKAMFDFNRDQTCHRRTL